MENLASISRPDPGTPVSGPGPIRPSPVQAKVPVAKKPRKARFVQEMERDEMFIPNDDVAVETKPMERRDFTKMVAASDINPDANVRPYVCGLCDQLSDQTTVVGLTPDGKPCPVVWRYSKCM